MTVKDDELRCDELWSQIVLLKPVIVIRQPFGRIDPHHILPKGAPAYYKFRFDIDNGIHLYRPDHTWAGNHPVELLDWLRLNRPEIYQWYLDHKDDKRLIELDYEQIERDLKEKLAKG